MPPLTMGNMRTNASSSQPSFMRSHDQQYDFGIVTRGDWGGNLFRRNVATGQYDALFDLATIIGNPLQMPINSIDDHWMLAFGLDSRNVCHIMGNTHATDWLYVTKDLSTWPPSTTWTAPAFSTLPWKNTGLQLHTYTYFWRYLDGTLVQFSDQEDSAVSTTAGRDFTGWKLPAGSGTWLPLNGTGEFAVTTGGVPEGQPDRIYLMGVCTTILSDGVTERLHVSGTWARRDPASPFLKRDPFYLYSDDQGTTFKSIQGVTLTMPLTYANYSPCAITSAATWNENAGAGCCIDYMGYPHIVQQNRDIASPKWLELYWDGSAWQQRAVTVTASGASVGPSVFAWKNELWFITTAFNRVRATNLSGNKAFSIGGPHPNGAKPMPEMYGQRDRSRLTFLISDGDNPAIYDLGVPTSPTP